MPSWSHLPHGVPQGGLVWTLRWSLPHVLQTPLPRPYRASLLPEGSIGCGLVSPCVYTPSTLCLDTFAIHEPAGPMDLMMLFYLSISITKYCVWVSSSRTQKKPLARHLCQGLRSELCTGRRLLAAPPPLGEPGCPPAHRGD